MVYSNPDFPEKAQKALCKQSCRVATSQEMMSYSKDYHVILQWFAKQETWKCESVRLAGLMVYGWMPTILRSGGRDQTPRPDFYDDIRQKLNSEQITESDYRFLNNSISGTSKFLHFWRPNEYAIWDSNVRLALGGSRHYGSIGQYVSYLSDIRAFAKANNTSIRTVEVALFQRGIDILREKRSKK